jgi:hypothetical protein
VTPLTQPRPVPTQPPPCDGLDLLGRGGVRSHFQVFPVLSGNLTNQILQALGAGGGVWQEVARLALEPWGAVGAHWLSWSPPGGSLALVCSSWCLAGFSLA